MEFLDTMENHRILALPEFPFIKFNFDFDKLLPSDVDHLPLFFNRYGSYLQHLEIKIGYSRAEHMSPKDFTKLRAIISLLQQAPTLTQLHLAVRSKVTTLQTAELTTLLPLALPNLKTLFLFLCNPEPNGKDPWTAFLIKLKNAAPKLQELFLNPSNISDFGNIAPGLRILQNTPNIFLTEGIHLWVECLLEFAESFRNPQHIQLTELHVDLSNPDVLNTDYCRLNFPRMLEPHSSKLKVFKLQTSGVESLSIPPLEFLKTLSIDFTSDWGVLPKSPIVPLTPGHFPNLKSVSLCYYDEDWLLFGTAHEPFLRVESLKFDHFESYEEFVRWNEIFPSLKRLELIDVGTKTVAIFIQQLLFISHLKLIFTNGWNAYHDQDPLEMCNLLASKLSTPTSSQISSLADFHNLQTMELHGTYWMVKTIVNITRCGYLKPLQRLTLKPDKGGITAADKEILNEVHQTVEWLR